MDPPSTSTRPAIVATVGSLLGVTLLLLVVRWGNPKLGAPSPTDWPTDSATETAPVGSPSRK